MRELAARDFPWFMRTWDAYPSGVQRADAFRYMVMYSVGGVYADLDFELLRPMDDFLRELSGGVGCALGQEPLEHVLLLERRDPSERRAMACNALLVSAPCHPFWLEMLKAAQRANPFDDPVSSTGPRLVSATLESLRRQNRSSDECRVEDSVTFYPAFDAKYQRNNIRSKCELLRSYPSQAARPPAAGGGNATLETRAGGGSNPLAWMGAGRVAALTPDARAGFALDMPVKLVPQARQLCAQLEARDYANPDKEAMRNTSLAVHHWVHTWIDGYDNLKSNI